MAEALQRGARGLLRWAPGRDDPPPNKEENKAAEGPKWGGIFALPHSQQQQQRPGARGGSSRAIKEACQEQWQRIEKVLQNVKF